MVIIIDIMEGKKNQCMALIFLLINKYKSLAINQTEEHSATSSTEAGNDSNDEPSNDEKPLNIFQLVTQHRRPLSLNIESKSAIGLHEIGTIKEEEEEDEQKIVDKEESSLEKPIKQSESVLKIKKSKRKLRKTPKKPRRTRSDPIKLIDYAESSTIQKLTIIQSYFRSYYAKNEYNEIKTRLRKLNKRIKKSPKKLKAFIRLQACIRRKLVLDTFSTRRQRNEIAKEILTTEASYVRSLSVLLSVYKDAFKNIDEELIPQTKLKSIFSEIEVIKGYNDLMYKRIENRMNNWYSEGQRLGDIFLQFTDFLKVYTSYVNNYNGTINMIHEISKHPKVADILKECRQNPLTSGLDIQSFLIMPIQRIPRYVLLISDLFKYTPKEHVDYENLFQALKKMEDVAQYVNQKKREAENLLGVLTVLNHLTNMDNSLEFNQPHRRYVRQGLLLEYEGVEKPLKSRYFFLFNDSLICSKEQKSVLLKKKPLTSSFDLDGLRNSDITLKFVYLEYLHGAAISELILENSKSTGIIEVSFPSGRKINIKFPYGENKDEWVQDIDEGIMSCLEKRRTRIEIPPKQEKAKEIQNKFVNNAQLSGFLYQLSQNGVWKKKFFILVHDIMYYYKKKENFKQGEAPIDKIYLLHSSVHVQSVMDRPFCFTLYTKERIYYFSAESFNIRMSWINQIRSNVMKHLDELETKMKQDLEKSSKQVNREESKKKRSSRNFQHQEIEKDSNSPNNKKRLSRKLDDEIDKETIAQTNVQIKKSTSKRRSLRSKNTLRVIQTGELFRVSITKNNFKKYTCELKNDELKYFRDNEKSILCGVINLLLVRAVGAIKICTIRNHVMYTFALSTTDGKQRFASNDEKTANLWLDKINQALSRLGK